MKTPRIYGWKPDLPDHRDFKLSYGAVELPTVVDLSSACSPVEDQSTLSSCTANASVAALEFLEKKAGLSDQAIEYFSRLFVYWTTRQLEYDTIDDRGAQIRDVVSALAQFGACNETLWPYDVQKVHEEPPSQAYSDALNHRISTYHGLDTLNDVLGCLAEGYPVIFGFTVFSNFESPAVAQTGVLGMPAPTDWRCGGHCVLATGYDLVAKTLSVRNSWGVKWGKNGYFTMPFEMVENGLATDFWTVRK